MTYRTAADLLGQMFPVNAGEHPETLRRHALKVGEALGNCAVARPETAASAIVVTLDSTFIRSREDGERHLEVRVGNVETNSGRRQVFGAVARAGTDLAGLIRRNLDAVGRTEATALTAFTDGCPGLRGILADAGIAAPPILDWFHIAMRLQHLKQIAGGLSADRKLWTALQALDGYLTGQSDWTVNYAQRHRAGLRVGTAITEGTANFLVNRRMNKSQQMRWSRRGADLLLQVRCAVYNGTLGSGFGQKFQPANDPYPPMAIAA
jgi:hypothetical protein